MKKKVDAARKKKSALKAVSFKRAEKYVSEYRQIERSLTNFKRAAKSKGNFYVPSEPKLAVVVRIRG